MNSGTYGEAYTSDTTVNNGGEVIVNTYYAEDDYVNSGGVVDVNSGGYTSWDVISAGGLEVVSSGGYASNTTVDTGGYFIKLAGGSATFDYGAATTSGVLLANPGSAVLYSTSSLNNQTVTNSGFEYVLEDVIAVRTNVSSGGEIVVDTGGYSSATKVFSGGTGVAHGGADSTTFLLNGAVEYTYGDTTSADVGRGANLYVEMCASATSTTVENKGNE